MCRYHYHFEWRNFIYFIFILLSIRLTVWWFYGFKSIRGRERMVQPVPCLLGRLCFVLVPGFESWLYSPSFLLKHSLGSNRWWLPRGGPGLSSWLMWAIGINQWMRVGFFLLEVTFLLSQCFPKVFCIFWFIFTSLSFLGKLVKGRKDLEQVVF